MSEENNNDNSLHESDIANEPDSVDEQQNSETTPENPQTEAGTSDDKPTSENQQPEASASEQGNQSTPENQQPEVNTGEPDIDIPKSEEVNNFGYASKYSDEQVDDSDVLIDNPERLKKQFKNRPNPGDINKYKYGGKSSDEAEEIDNSDILIGNPERLKKQLERVNNDIGEKEEEEKDLTEKIKVISNQIRKLLEDLQKYQLETNREEFKQKREVIRQELDKLQDLKFSLEKRLKKAERIKQSQPRNKEEFERQSQEAKNISTQSLFKHNEPIENTVLYVATFFPQLSPQDFERVVSYLLEGRTIPVTTKSRVTTEQGETREIENYEDKPVVEIWQESLDNPEKYLGKCYLKSNTQEDASQVIDFYLPLNEEDRLKKYFQEEQPLFLSRQFERAKLLLFDNSKKVAAHAMYLSTEMALASPTAYGEDWLFSIIEELTLSETQEINLEQITTPIQHLSRIGFNKRQAFIFSRISSLITEMLNYEQLENVVKRLLDNLIGGSRYEAAWEIIKRLQSAPKFSQFYWIKQLLDRGEGKIPEQAYSFLFNQLKSNSYQIYLLLDIIKEWLPKRDIDLETSSRSDKKAFLTKCSDSNKLALWILFEYCIKTTSDFNLKDYGCWTSKYPLFAALEKEDDDSINSKLEILASWLFHPGLQLICNEDSIVGKIDNIENDENPEKYDKKNEIEFTLYISGLIVDWFSILTPPDKLLTLQGLNKRESNPKAAAVFDSLIEQIAKNTDKLQKNELKLSLDLLHFFYYKESEKYTYQGKTKPRRICNINKNTVRKIKKKFRAAVKEKSVNKENK